MCVCVCGYVCVADFDEFESKEDNTYTHAHVHCEPLKCYWGVGYVVIYCVYRILGESLLKLKMEEWFILC